METTVKDLAFTTLTWPGWVVFVLFIMAGSNWYDSSNPTPGQITMIANIIGGTAFIAWLYAVGHKANDHLQSKNIALPVFQFFNYSFIVLIGSVLIMLLLSQGTVSFGNEGGHVDYHITYTKPLGLSLLFASSLLFAVFIAAKALVSAEMNKEAEFKDYFSTLVLFAILWIGVWFIQPRARNLS